MGAKAFSVKLSEEDAELLEQIASDRGATSAEILRDATRLYLYGEANKQRGVDAGYVAGRSFATQVSYELLRSALENAPATHEEAVAFMAKRKDARIARAKKARA